MSQNQHYLPQSYLKQWCNDGTLFEYRRVGPLAKLCEEKKSARGIACELDLYTLPEGGVANGLTGTGLELKLARDVDERIPEIIIEASRFSHHVDNASIADNIRWLMRTFVARSPASVRRAESGYPNIVDKHREMLARLLAHAATPAMRAELNSFVDPRMPSVMTRAVIGAVIEGAMPPGNKSWLNGEVHLLHFAEFERWLAVAGAGEFVTFHEPVIEWDTGLVASFALSPNLLALVVQPGAMFDETAYGNIVLGHTLTPLAYRRSLYCRSAATGELLSHASTLIPWTQ